MSDVDEILGTLEDYARAYCAKDVNGLMELFDVDAEVSLIGTGKDELFDNRKKIRAHLKRNFKAAKAERFEWHWRHVTVSVNAAAVAATLSIHLDTKGEKPVVPVRWTVVLTRRGAGWRWLHHNVSLATPQQGDGVS